MSLAERIVRAFGGTPASDLPAVIDRALVPHREAMAAEIRSFQTTTGDAFQRGIESLLMGGVLGPLRRFGRPEFSSHTLVYACMSLIAESVASVPFKLWKKQRDGSPGEQVSDHPLLEALADPFPDLYPSFSHFVELLVLYGLGGGNAWIMPDDVLRSKSRIPVSFTVLGRPHVRPLQDASWRLVAWQLTFGATPRNLRPEELAHFKRANPDDLSQVLGVGELEAARRDVNSDFARQVYDEQFFANGAAPSLVLKYEGTGPEGTRRPLEIDDLKAATAAFADKHAGAEKMQKVAGLNLGWSLEKLGVSQRDMEFIQGFLHTTRRVAMAFRVPSVLLNDREHGGLSQEEIRGANAQLAQAQTVPWCRRLSAFFQRVFVEKYAPGLIGGFDTDEIEALKVNFDKKVDNYVKLVGAQVSPRDASELVDLGLDPAKLSDEPLVPFSLTKLSDVLADDPAPVAAAPMLPPGTPKTDPEAQPEPTPAGDRKVILLAPSAIRRALATRADAAREAQRTHRWRAFVAGLTPIERRYHRAVRKYVFGLRAETLANLADAKVAAARMRGIDDDIRKILFDERAADARLRNLSSPFFEEAIRVGSTSAALDLDADPIGIEAPGMAEFLELKEIKVVGINDTIRDALRVTLREGLNEGETLNDLAGRVRQVFDASASRARTIARTEMATTVNGARFLELADQGVERIEWLSARDEHVRQPPASPFNHAIDGEEIAIGERFSNDLRFPGDPDGAAGNLINCRCTANAA